MAFSISSITIVRIPSHINIAVAITNISVTIAIAITNISIAIAIAITNISIAIMLITFQEPRMKTAAVKRARMPEMRMNGFQLSKFAACIRPS